MSITPGIRAFASRFGCELPSTFGIEFGAEASATVNPVLAASAAARAASINPAWAASAAAQKAAAAAQAPQVNPAWAASAAAQKAAAEKAAQKPTAVNPAWAASAAAQRAAAAQKPAAAPAEHPAVTAARQRAEELKKKSAQPPPEHPSVAAARQRAEELKKKTALQKLIEISPAAKLMAERAAAPSVFTHTETWDKNPLTTAAVVAAADQLIVQNSPTVAATIAQAQSPVSLPTVPQRDIVQGANALQAVQYMRDMMQIPADVPLFPESPVKVEPVKTLAPADIAVIKKTWWRRLISWFKSWTV